MSRDPGQTTSSRPRFLWHRRLVGVAPTAVGWCSGGTVTVLPHLCYPLHQLVGRREKDIQAVMQLVLIALVILPLLPVRPFGSPRWPIGERRGVGQKTQPTSNHLEQPVWRSFSILDDPLRRAAQQSLGDIGRSGVGMLFQKHGYHSAHKTCGERRSRLTDREAIHRNGMDFITWSKKIDTTAMIRQPPSAILHGTCSDGNRTRNAGGRKACGFGTRVTGSDHTGNTTGNQPLHAMI